MRLSMWQKVPGKTPLQQSKEKLMFDDVLRRQRRDDVFYTRSDSIPQPFQTVIPAGPPADIVPVELPGRVHLPHERMGKPAFNLAYDQLRTHGHEYSIAVFPAIAGTILLTNGGSTTLIPLAVPQNAAAILTDVWPGSIQAYPVLLNIGLAPQLATDVGDLQLIWQDQAGYAIALGDLTAATGGNLKPEMMSPNGIHDPGLKSLGSIAVTWNGGVATDTYGYTVQFGVRYMWLTDRPGEKAGMDDQP